MPRNALLDESRDRQWPVGLPGWSDKVRIQPTVEAVLDAARPATLGKGDQLVQGALKTALIERIILGDFRAVYVTLGALLGLSDPNGEVAGQNGAAGNQSSTHALADWNKRPNREVTPQPGSGEDRKPLAKATGR